MVCELQFNKIFLFKKKANKGGRERNLNTKLAIYM